MVADDEGEGERQRAGGRGSVLVIGYGSDLRGDDAVGRRAAEAVAACDLPGVRVLSVPQLVPELAIDLARCRAAIFVDASAADETVVVRRLASASSPSRLTHSVAPHSLLALAAVVDAAPEEAVVVTVPASDFGLSTTLSEATTMAMSEAVERIVRLCHDLQSCHG
jgi:hydrogenase maturation protease